nr:PREDICTED: uncharacterized protein LOC102355403 [Latimeria chalumnae]|eukprot:XP_014349373.1 PREDICTED: uncharacterized protein LOC102355403 [Latimeria chalumnae]
MHRGRGSGDNAGESRREADENSIRLSRFCFLKRWEPSSSSSFANRKIGFMNFFHFSKRVCQHERSKEHVEAITRWIELAEGLEKGRTIDKDMQTCYQMQKDTWRNILSSLGYFAVLSHWDVLKKHIRIILKCQSMTRWSTRVEAIRPLRNQVEGVLDALDEIKASHNLTPELKSEADSLQTNISEFSFIILAEVWCTILSKINIVSKKLQSPDLDIPTARGVLGGLRDALSELRSSGFVACKEAAASQAETLGISMQFTEKPSRRRKVMPGILAKDERSSDPEKVFECEVFNPVLDTVLTQLDNRMPSSYPEESNSESFENEIELFANFCKRIFEDDLETKAPIDLLNYMYIHKRKRPSKGFLTHLHLSTCLALQTLLWIPAFSQPSPQDSGNALDVNTVCPQIRIGQDDLPGFDLITQFQLDVAHLRGVRRVEGSTLLQIAYRLEKEANFQIPTRILYPKGLPEEYSFVTTFRMMRETIDTVWNLFQIVDEDGYKQIGLRLDGEQQAVEFFLVGQDGNLEVATFPGVSQLFNTEWHKILVGVEMNKITLFVDCQLVGSKPIKTKGTVNVDGETLIGRLDDDPSSSVVLPTSQFGGAGRAVEGAIVQRRH